MNYLRDEDGGWDWACGRGVKVGREVSLGDEEDAPLGDGADVEMEVKLPREGDFDEFLEEGREFVLIPTATSTPLEPTTNPC
jgi:hypothetical protein